MSGAGVARGEVVEEERVLPELGTELLEPRHRAVPVPRLQEERALQEPELGILGSPPGEEDVEGGPRVVEAPLAELGHDPLGGGVAPGVGVRGETRLAHAVQVPTRDVVAGIQLQGPTEALLRALEEPGAEVRRPEVVAELRVGRFEARQRLVDHDHLPPRLLLLVELGEAEEGTEQVRVRLAHPLVLAGRLVQHLVGGEEIPQGHARVGKALVLAERAVELAHGRGAPPLLLVEHAELELVQRTAAQSRHRAHQGQHEEQTESDEARKDGGPRTPEDAVEPQPEAPREQADEDTAGVPLEGRPPHGEETAAEGGDPRGAEAAPAEPEPRGAQGEEDPSRPQAEGEPRSLGAIGEVLRGEGAGQGGGLEGPQRLHAGAEDLPVGSAEDVASRASEPVPGHAALVEGAALLAGGMGPVVGGGPPPTGILVPAQGIPAAVVRAMALVHLHPAHPGEGALGAHQTSRAHHREEEHDGEHRRVRPAAPREEHDREHRGGGPAELGHEPGGQGQGERSQGEGQGTFRPVEEDEAEEGEQGGEPARLQAPREEEGGGGDPHRDGARRGGPRPGAATQEEPHQQREPGNEDPAQQVPGGDHVAGIGAGEPLEEAEVHGLVGPGEEVRVGVPRDLPQDALASHRRPLEIPPVGLVHGEGGHPRQGEDEHDEGESFHGVASSSRSRVAAVACTPGSPFSSASRTAARASSMRPSFWKANPR